MLLHDFILACRLMLNHFSKLWNIFFYINIIGPKWMHSIFKSLWFYFSVRHISLISIGNTTQVKNGHIRLLLAHMWTMPHMIPIHFIAAFHCIFGIIFKLILKQRLGIVEISEWILQAALLGMNLIFPLFSVSGRNLYFMLNIHFLNILLSL